MKLSKVSATPRRPMTTPPLFCIYHALPGPVELTIKIL